MKMSTARYNIEKKKKKKRRRRRRRNERDKKKETKMKMGNDGKMHRLIKKHLSSFTWTHFKVDCNVKGAVVVYRSTGP